MKGSLSIFLDSLRVIASLAVLIGHADMLGFLQLHLPNGFGHRWVIVFFVLSGFIITYSTAAKHKDAKDYATARLSRLSSVVVPALIFSAIVDLIIWAALPEFFQSHARSNLPLRYALSFFYLQEIWTISASPATNSPLWSLAYEFWYYTIFALAWFPKNKLTRIALVTLCAVAIGPKILLLMPIWLLGAAVYFMIPKMTTSPSWRIGCALASAIFVFLVWRPIPNPFSWRTGYAPLFYSTEFLPDFLMGLVVALMILSFALGCRDFQFSSALAKPIRATANVTFTCYLFHFPLLLLAKGFLGKLAPNSLASILVVAGTIVAVALIGTQTELRRNLWTRLIARIFALCERKSSATEPNAVHTHS